MSDHKTLAELANEDEHQRRLRHEAEVAELRSLNAEIKRRQSAIAAREAYMQTIAAHAPMMASVPTLERVGRRTSKSKPVHTWGLMISDMHMGQKTEAESTGQLFTQSSELCLQQIKTLTNKIERLHWFASKYKHIERLWLPVLGDIVEGDGMRASQHTKIDALVTRQTVEAAKQLASLIEVALHLFPEVEVDMVGGNHDRTSQKAGDGGLGELGYEDTYAWLMGAFLEWHFDKAIKSGRLKFTNWSSFFGGHVVYGRKFVFEHGCSFKTSSGSYGGIGWYPIQNAAGKYAQMLDGADFVLFGHFHRAAVLPFGRGRQLLNGAFPPSTAWVQSSFKTVVMPEQMMFEMHPEHGFCGYQPISLPHEGLAEPGAFWERVGAS